MSTNKFSLPDSFFSTIATPLLATTVAPIFGKPVETPMLPETSSDIGASQPPLADPVKDVIEIADIGSVTLSDPEPASVDDMTSAETKSTSLPAFASRAEAALHWNAFGLKVMPVMAKQKIPAVPWDAWFADLSVNKIADHWAKHGDHELCCLVGENHIVYDADTPMAIEALVALESKFGIKSKWVVKTTRGEHHHFQRAAGTLARSDSHSTENHPERLDVKTGRNLVMLPPSTGKTIVYCDANHVSELSVVTQEFIDAVALHNGRTPRSKLEVSPKDADYVPIKVAESVLKNLVEAIKPDLGYGDWLNVLMVIFHETGGSDDGLALADLWSREGKTYQGIRDIETKWRSFRLDVPNPVTIATLIKMAREAGADVDAILMGGEQFEPCETEVVQPSAQMTPTIATVPNPQIANPLTRYSLRDSLAELEKQRVEQRLILGDLVLLGQATVLYALANTGKTLIVIYLILEAIRKKLFDPSKLFYINMDDNSSGLVEKVGVLAEYGCHMLADGHQGFAAKAFSVAMQKMIETGTARGVIVVLDTLKKFVNTMNKDESREFAGVVRRFCLKGGTVIALSHANKNPGPDGKVKYTGTTDIVDDFDCAYTLQTVSQDDATQRVVEFTNIKRRGDVVMSAAYSYTLERGVSYSELLASVQEVNPDQLEPIKQAAALQSGAVVIAAIESCIGEGITSKMKLADVAADRTKVSKRAAMQVLEKYTGEDPSKHRWKFVVRDRGAKVFELLVRPAEPPAAPDDLTT